LDLKHNFNRPYIRQVTGLIYSFVLSGVKFTHHLIGTMIW